MASSAYAYRSALSRAEAEAKVPLSGGAGAAAAKPAGSLAGLLFSKAGIAAALVVVAVVATAAALAAPKAGGGGGDAAPSLSAVARLDNNTIAGSVTFTQLASGGPVTITVALSGAPTALLDGQHGFHVHANPSLGGSSTCADTGAHWNPAAVAHGGPSSSVRHVGDLGNVPSAGGVIAYTFSDARVSLRAVDTSAYIVGRAVLLHDYVDDLGMGPSTGAACGRNGASACTSNTTGNAGARLACGVIVAALSGAPASALRGA